MVNSLVFLLTAVLAFKCEAVSSNFPCGLLWCFGALFHLGRLIIRHLCCYFPYLCLSKCLLLLESLALTSIYQYGVWASPIRRGVKWVGHMTLSTGSWQPSSQLWSSLDHNFINPETGCPRLNLTQSGQTSQHCWTQSLPNHSCFWKRVSFLHCWAPAAFLISPAVFTNFPSAI